MIDPSDATVPTDEDYDDDHDDDLPATAPVVLPRTRIAKISLQISVSVG